MDRDLSQADLSKKTIKQMTADERAELKRRFESFVDNFVPKSALAAAPAPSRVRKWVPGMKK